MPRKVNGATSPTQLYGTVTFSRVEARALMAAAQVVINQKPAGWQALESARDKVQDAFEPEPSGEIVGWPA